MRLDQIERQPGNRKARRWSLWLAVAVHMLLLGVVLHLWSSGLRDITLSAAQPMLSGEVIDAQALPPVEVEATVQGNFAVEPSAELVDSMAQRMLRDSRKAGGHSLSDVREKAELLERISNAGEIQKMADHLRSTLGAELEGIDAANEDAPPVDWNNALPISAKRVEADDVLEVHEVYADPAGGRTVMIHTRKQHNDAVEYTTGFIERGIRGEPVESTKEEFEAALARIEPIEMMQEYPLLRELHRAAILPILHKMVAQYEADERAARGNPILDGHPTTKPNGAEKPGDSSDHR